MNSLRDVVERLQFLLRLHGRSRRPVRRMTYTSLPMVNSTLFEGYPVQRLMSPPVPITGTETQLILDSWLYPVQCAEGDAVKDVIAASSPQLYAFMAQSTRFADMTVRLIYALGNADGATMTYDETSIMVTHGDRSFGIKDGKVVSRFCSGMQIAARPKKVIEARRLTRTFDEGFCSMYKEAYRRGKGADQALIAIHMGNPGFDFDAMAREARPFVEPTDLQMVRWEATLSGKPDPLLCLYKQLVPKWMTAPEFNASFGNVTKRPIELNPLTTQKYINLLHLHFHKNKKKEEQK